MISLLVMLGFSIYLAGYGYIALFKKEWLMKIRAFSARVEGKGDLKRDELSDSGQARMAMAVIALILGIIGLVMTAVMFYVYFQAQSGPISV